MVDHHFHGGLREKRGNGSKDAEQAVMISEGSWSQHSASSLLLMWLKIVIFSLLRENNHDHIDTCIVCDTPPEICNSTTSACLLEKISIPRYVVRMIIAYYRAATVIMTPLFFLHVT
jgi:hypothetical protein